MADTTKGLPKKVALVTGGSRGIGAAIARRLASDGAAVAITYNASPEKANEVIGAIEAGGGKALAIKADSADAAAVKAAVVETVEHFGRLDVLVNNAGILLMGAVDSFSLEDFDRIVAVNVRALFAAVQQASKHMGEGGRIVNIGSMVADRTGFPGAAFYGMTKAAVASLTRGFAIDLAPRGITVNNLQPGPTATDMNPADGHFADLLRSRIPLGRFGTADEIAGFVAYLASPESGFVTGASLTIDGGLTV
jgi:3-oxoacyl-[acyl-carrier protein] reductase